MQASASTECPLVPHGLSEERKKNISLDSLKKDVHNNYSLSNEERKIKLRMARARGGGCLIDSLLKKKGEKKKKKKATTQNNSTAGTPL